MLRWLTRISRRRAAALLIAAYAMCVAAPAAALAFSDLANVAHCLTDNHHNTAAHHVHQDDGASHDHPGTGNSDNAQPANCCGLFCVTAISQTHEMAVAMPILRSDVQLAAAKTIDGRGPDRIDRPPRSLLSF